jgi:purine-binding chemotaxis protein CheW
VTERPGQPETLRRMAERVGDVPAPLVPGDGGVPGLLQLVVFRVGNVHFAIDLHDVVGIERLPAHRPPVRFLRWHGGLLDVRGEAVPLVDLRDRFGVPGRAPEGQAHVLIVELGSGLLGLVVDAVADPGRMSRGCGAAAPIPGLPGQDRFLRGAVRIDSGAAWLVDPHFLLLPAEAAELARTSREAGSQSGGPR